ncbi:MAG: hypothetical protein QOG03_585 [Actinomycetota bacterium]|jgi:hypothetical protein|nr:hypothetical protein [Actinomycetota bacterium]
METQGADQRHHAVTDRGLALILISHVDRRVLPALSLAARLPEFDLKAVHLSFDPLESQQLARDWMELGFAWIPLHITEPGDETFVDSVRSVVEEESEERSRVLVIVPELDLDRWWQTLLHRSTGRRIARSLQALHRVSTIVLPYAL